MVFTSPLGLGFRHASGAISRSCTIVLIRPCQSNLRFSSVLQTPHRRALRGSLGTRSFFWKSSPAPAASPPPAAELPATPAVSEVADTSTALDATSAFDTPADIDPSTVVEAIPSDLTETLISNVPAALQYGDMAALGLAGWSPAGLVRWSMELINVSTGMPWFWTIIVGSALWRLVCVPWAIRGFQISARLLPLQPQILELQKAIAKSRQSQNPLELQKAAQAMSRFYKTHNISPFAGLVSLVQLPITFGLFFGVQKMCNFPVEQLRDSGFALLPDLTLTDPTMVLPLVMFALVNTQIKLSIRDFNTVERPDMAHLMNIFRLLTIPGIYLMSSLPSGLIVSLLTTTLLTMLQTLLLRIPALRVALKIPSIPIELQGKLPRFRDTFERIKRYYSSDLKGKVDRARKEALARQRMGR